MSRIILSAKAWWRTGLCMTKAMGIRTRILCLRSGDLMKRDSGRRSRKQCSPGMRTVKRSHSLIRRPENRKSVSARARAKKSYGCVSASRATTGTTIRRRKSGVRPGRKHAISIWRRISRSTTAAMHGRRKSSGRKVLTS